MGPIYILSDFTDHSFSSASKLYFPSRKFLIHNIVIHRKIGEWTVSLDYIKKECLVV